MVRFQWALGRQVLSSWRHKTVSLRRPISLRQRATGPKVQEPWSRENLPRPSHALRGQELARPVKQNPPRERTWPRRGNVCRRCAEVSRHRQRHWPCWRFVSWAYDSSLAFICESCCDNTILLLVYDTYDTHASRFLDHAHWSRLAFARHIDVVGVGLLS
jgi:hypothetical protein